ncbi:MAG TPA: hypothetical protein VFI31_09240 [Pirellulales bacterium]|nr:hypothetical protein [Pirellulales bacterium]
MPQTRDIALEQLAAAGDALSVTETRVDAAHTIGDALASLPPLAEMPVAEAITELVRVEGAIQLQSQAEQLAARLRERQQELDRRESQLNARLAEFEKEVRDARLWLAQRDEKLSEREERLAASVGNGAPSGPPDVPPTNMFSGAAELDTDLPNSVRNAHRAFPPATDEWRGSLTRQSEELDRRRVALEKFQKKVSQMHREALQLRLAADEAQAELRVALGADRAEEAMAAARERLERHYQNELTELTHQRQELQQMKFDLASEHDRLAERCQELKMLARDLRS